MTRYLRPDLLEDCGCSRFDDWAATFGMIKTQNKKTATGELKLKTCFAGFKNRPELIKMYKDFADLVTIDKITAPDKDGNAPEIIVPKVKSKQHQSSVRSLRTLHDAARKFNLAMSDLMKIIC